MVTQSTVEALTRSKVNTRQRLVEAAVGVFTAKGVDGATIDDLTSAAGFTRGAFYSSFSHREDVFWEAFSYATSRALEVILAAGPPEEQGADAHFEPTENLMSVLDSIRPVGLAWYVMHTEAVNLARRNAEFRSRVAHERRRLIEAIAHNFETLESTGMVKLNVPAFTVGETLLGVYLNRMIVEFIEGEQQSDATSHVIDVVLDGLMQRTPQGEKALGA